MTYITEAMEGGAILIRYILERIMNERFTFHLIEMIIALIIIVTIIRILKK